MKQICMILLVLLVLTSCKQEKRQLSKNKKPNFIVIVMDDLDFDEVNFYASDSFPCYFGAFSHGIKSAGASTVSKARFYTPNLDKLAERSAIFNRFYANSSVCTPVRYALLTGNNAWHSPFLDRETAKDQPAFFRWNSFISPQEKTIIQPLHKRGYKAAIIGKWHNGANGRGITIPTSKDDLTDPVKSKIIKQDYEYFLHFLTDSLGFDYADRIFYDNPFILNLEWITEGVKTFIDKFKDDPFYLYLPLPFPHAQYYDYKDYDPLATPAGMLEKAPDGGHTLSEARMKIKMRGMPLAFSMATWIDDFVGVVYAKLKEYGLDENTMIVFTSDQQTRGKYTCYETCRIPTFIYYPPMIKKQEYINELCLINDLIPTMFEIIDGKKIENNPYEGMSLVPLFNRKNNQQIEWRSDIYMEISYCKGIVTDRYKYVAARPPMFVYESFKQDSLAAIKENRRRKVSWDGQNWNWPGVVYDIDRDFPCYFDKDQLYDLQKDVFEQKNLAYLPEYQAVLAEMKNRLKKQMVNYPFKFGEFSTEKRK